MEKKHIHSNKDFGSSVGKNAIFTKHLTDLDDQINVLQKAVTNSGGHNLLKIATISSGLGKILPNLKNSVHFQWKRCGHELVYQDKNPYRARRTYYETTVVVGSSRVDT